MLQGDETQLDGPKGLALNGSGVLFVANDSGPVTESSTSWRGNRPPSGEVSGSLTGLANSEQVLLGPTDDTLRVDSLTEGTITTYPMTRAATSPRPRRSRSARTRSQPSSRSTSSTHKPDSASGKFSGRAQHARRTTSRAVADHIVDVGYTNMT